MHKWTCKRKMNSRENCDAETSFKERPTNGSDDEPSQSVTDNAVLKEIAKAMTLIAEKSAQKHVTIGADALPKFDPRDYELSSENWCRKVDECRQIFGWTESTTVYLALSKLTGLALPWYKSLPSITYSWSEWKTKLITAFPPKRDFYELLERMMARKKKKEEDYVTYYYSKLTLLNLVEITGTQAVSCIIGGIWDPSIKNAAKSGRYETPEALFEYLSTVTEQRVSDNVSRSSKSRPSYSRDRRDSFKPREVICYKCKKAGHTANKCSEQTDQNVTCFKCQKTGHKANQCPESTSEIRCGICRMHGHRAKDCRVKDRRDGKEKTVALIGRETLIEPSNRKYHKTVYLNGQATSAYVDTGSACTTITEAEVERLKLNNVDKSDVSLLYGYGNGTVSTLGSVYILLKVDEVEASVNAEVVPTHVQEVSVLIGRTFTELPRVCMLKDDQQLRFYRTDDEHGLVTRQKVVLRVAEKTIVPSKHQGYVPVTTADQYGDVFIEETMRTEPGCEHYIPAVVVTCQPVHHAVLPVSNLSDNNLELKENSVLARGWTCLEDDIPSTIMKVNKSSALPLPWDKISIGPVDEKVNNQLLELLVEFRDCFALTTQELGCAGSSEMSIQLCEEKPFTYRPYRLSPNEARDVQKMVDELLEAGIIKPSMSNYASPVIIVDKKNGQKRLCVDYRRLNALTVKDSHPLPKISDQIDRLQGGKCFTSLDLRSGYHQIGVEAASQKYTSFVTPFGQYEYVRMPFGLTNAPRVFQRFMNHLLRPVADLAAVYLDDVLLHSPTPEQGLKDLRKFLELLRREGLTLNFEKCSFLQESIKYLGFEICDGKIQPGVEKTKAVDEFPTPTNPLQIRQFVGLTGYFRQFVANYAEVARPLTNLTRSNVSWKWGSEEEKAFNKLREVLVSRPVLAIYNAQAVTELHTDASSLGIAGILMQYQPDGRLHPVSYYSRQTNDCEQKYHSFELETLAVVESIKKFRVYLLDVEFTVVTDCNAIKASSTKINLIPRVARWWLQLQEFKFTVKYRPGTQMKHADALSRNPPPAKVLRLEKSDWILAGQLTDPKIQSLHQILSKPPTTEDEHRVYKNYALRDGRVYRITARGIQWYVPRGMRQQVVRSAHDDFGHFGLEKTLYRISDCYWFPRMREYIKKYLACCVQCIMKKRTSGKREGFLHPIPKPTEPFDTIHLDHLGPFPKTRSGNVHILAVVDAFTKFLFIKPVKSTKTSLVLNFLDELFHLYGTPKTAITDQGSSFTAKKYKTYCQAKGCRHVKIAVGTPRANGQVERLNRSILSALMTSTLEDDLWDKEVQGIQFAINNLVNESTGKSPSELFFGYKPRSGTDIELRDEVQQIPRIVNDLVKTRQEAWERMRDVQARQKVIYDRKRKAAKDYSVGDIVVIEKAVYNPGESQKLTPAYSSPMIVKAVLENDRYLVADMPGTHRVKGAKYEKIIAADRMKLWCLPGGVSDETGDESGEDGVLLSDPDSDQ